MVYQFSPIVWGIFAAVAIGTIVYGLVTMPRLEDHHHRNTDRNGQQSYEPNNSFYRSDTMDDSLSERRRRRRRRFTNDSCSICLNNLDDDRTMLICGHVFHISCIDKWFKIGRTCPNCREQQPQ